MFRGCKFLITLWTHDIFPFFQWFGVNNFNMPLHLLHCPEHHWTMWTFMSLHFLMGPLHMVLHLKTCGICLATNWADGAFIPFCMNNHHVLFDWCPYQTLEFAFVRCTAIEYINSTRIWRSMFILSVLKVVQAAFIDRSFVAISALMPATSKKTIDTRQRSDKNKRIQKSVCLRTRLLCGDQRNVFQN